MASVGSKLHCTTKENQGKSVHFENMIKDSSPLDRTIAFMETFH
jgi:hypothetical protein